MCKICKEVGGLDKVQALAKIGKAMSKGQSGEHFAPVLDRILGTEAPAQDQELDEAWENSTRGDRK